MRRGQETGVFIGDIAKKLSISQRTIRYYEELGLIKPSRTNGGFRIYEEDQVERLRMILLLKELGMSLEEIVQLTQAWHRGVPSDVAPALRDMLLSHLKGFRRMIAKYEKGIAELEAVLKLLKTCVTCGRDVEHDMCKTCLSKRDEEIPPLMKTLL